MKRFLLIYLLALCALIGTPVFADEQEVADTASWAQLSGRVLDEDGQGVPFVSVKVSGQLLGTATNLQGNYSLRLPPADSVVVTYSMMGYEPKQKLFTA